MINTNNDNDTVGQAIIAGRYHFKRGGSSVPLSDPWITSRILPTPGANVKMYRAWQKGWMAANLAAPVPD